MAENFRSPRKIARRLRYLPKAISKIRNWPSFMYHYALGLRPEQAYVFRNGAELMISRGVDHVPILEQRDEAVEAFNRAVASEMGVRDLYVNGGEFFPHARWDDRSGESRTRCVRSTTSAEIMEANRLEHVDLLKMVLPRRPNELAARLVVIPG